jgi:thiamine-phosphate pyrophosphorylase
LVLGVAGNTALAERLGASFVHNPDGPGELPCSMAVHDEAQARAAREAGAVLAFVGPIHPTRSHPGRPALGEERAVRLARIAGCPAIALGGMNEARLAALESAHPGAFHGFAGIDCWLKS